MTKNISQQREPESGQNSINLPVSNYFRAPFLLIAIIGMLQACTAVNTFPTIARQGDTVSIMVGGSEEVRKDTISATLTDSNDVAWDLQLLGNIRSVFNLRTDGGA